MTTTIFLHGLDSSGRGTKGRYLKSHFPELLCPDFTGTLNERLDQLDQLLPSQENLIMIGSSFGGLMACCYALTNPDRHIDRLVLLAPALNFAEYRPPKTMLSIPTLLVIGQHDSVTPPELVLPMAKQTFAQLEIMVADDDHMLHNTFTTLPWPELLCK